jgi:hypothetical protein
MEAKATFHNTSHTNDAPYAEHGPAKLARASIRRTYSGDVTGESTAEAIVCQTGPARMAYVGVDRFEGTVLGRKGRFVFQHGGIIENGKFVPFGYIVPGSGTDELAGIRGDCVIQVTAPGQHAITFAFELPAAPPS